MHQPVPIYVLMVLDCCICHLLQVMAGWGGVMGWDEWSARHVEKEFVRPEGLRVKANPKVQEEVETCFVGSIWSWVSGRKRREREEERINRWYVF